MTTLTVAESAQVNLTADCIRLDDLARDLAIVGKPLLAAIYRRQAALAYRAAKAEADNPEPALIAPCRICGGVSFCEATT